MKFWKTHLGLRAILMAALFVVGLALTIVGWKMTGKLEGLGLMMLGLVFLLSALFVYNGLYRNKGES